ncbi:MAG: acyltransferase family protein [Cyclobacteriaceae bacterium]|nr:acyltransferase family protein [Cyclobacteriaceae bacterium]
MAEKKFLSYIHSFRGVAILFVVIGHTIVISPDSNRLQTIIFSIFHNGTVLFVFIAGYLFQYLSSKFEFRDYCKKKFQNVIFPYLIISIPAIVLALRPTSFPFKAVVENIPDFGTWSTVSKVLFYYITGGHLLPLWFIPMITIFYAIAPLLLKLDRNPKAYLILPLLVVVSILVERQAAIYIHISFIHFLSVYLFGMFFSHYNERILNQPTWAAVLLTGLYFLFLGITFFKPSHYGSWMYIQKMLLCWPLIFFLRKFDNYVPKKITNILADLSFGIFFFHFYFLMLIQYLFKDKDLHLSALALMILSPTIILILNVLFLLISKKILGKYSKFLLGC